MKFVPPITLAVLIACGGSSAGKRQVALQVDGMFKAGHAT